MRWDQRLGAFLLLFVIGMGIIGPYLSGYTYHQTALDQMNHPPSLQHWFGTDELGRDIFTRVWMGARISLFVGFSAAFLDLIIGVFWGATAAFSGGKIDEWMMRVPDLLTGIPHLLVTILMIVIIGPGIGSIIFALAVTGWVTMARVVRSQVLHLRSQEYVLAAKTMNAPFFWIIRHHLIPNALRPIIITLSLTIPSAIFSEATLSFVGLGIPPPMASWGTMAKDALPALFIYPWRLFFPAMMICITMFSFQLLADSPFEEEATSC